MSCLFSKEAVSRRIALLDNVKSLRFSWSELEGLITADTISGRQLYVGEGRRPNTLTWVMTLNGANLSTDMAQRCIIVKVARPEYSATWEGETIAYIENKRWEIIGDILALLRAPSVPLSRYSRWGAWEAGVLSRVAEPADCQQVIEERQRAVDDDKLEAEVLRAFIESELRKRGHDPDHQTIRIPSQEMGVWVNAATGEKRAINKANAYLATLWISELRNR